MVDRFWPRAHKIPPLLWFLSTIFDRQVDRVKVPRLMALKSLGHSWLVAERLAENWNELASRRDRNAPVKERG